MPQTLCRWLRAALLTTLGSASAAPFLPPSHLAAQAVRDALTPDISAAPVATPPAAVTAAPVRARVTVQKVTAQKAASRGTAAKSVVPRNAVPKAPAQKTVVQKVAVQKVAQAPVAQKAQARKPAPRVQTAAKLPVPQTAAQARARGVQLAPVGRSSTARSVVARATAYNSMPGQTDSTPFITATGTRTRPGVVALSRDLLRSFPYGSKVMIEDLSGRSGSLLHNRVFYVEDTMAAYKTRSVDIWMASYGQAIQFGARQVRVTAVR